MHARRSKVTSPRTKTGPTICTQRAPADGLRARKLRPDGFEKTGGPDFPGPPVDERHLITSDCVFPHRGEKRVEMAGDDPRVADATVGSVQGFFAHAVQ